MPTVGPHDASVFGNDSGNGSSVAWSAPENAESSDDTYAMSSGGGLGGQLLQRLTAKSVAGFSSLADDDVVSQIVVEVERKGNAVDSEAKLIVGGVIQSDNLAKGETWPAADAYATYSFPVDLTGAHVKAATFGFALAAVEFSGGAARVDHIRFTATYTPAPETPDPSAEPAIRGSWTIHQGIIGKWNDSQMDAYVRGLDQWVGNANAANFLPLCEGEARPKTPFPFVVYGVADPIRVSGDSGRTHDQHTLTWDYRVTFEVHARRKDTARNIAAAIAGQYESKSLCVSPDGWVSTTPVADVSFREGDENWVWRLMYDVRVTADYLTRRG